MVHISHNEQDEKKQKQVDDVTCYDALHDFIYYGLGWAANAGIGVLTTEYAFNRSGNFIYNTREKAVDFAMNMAEKIFHNVELEELTKNIGARLNENGLGGEAAKILQEQAKDGKFKQAFYDLHSQNGGYEGIAKMLDNSLDAEKIKEAADHMIKKQGGRELFNTAAVLATLCVGGFAVMVPMKLMEDNKRWLVEQLDHKVVDPINSIIGKAPKTDEAKAELEQKRQQRYEEIEAEPQQTWGSMLTSRIIALVPLYALHAAWWNENNAIKYAGGAIAGAEITNPSPEIGFGGVGHYAKKTGNLVGGKIYDILPDNWQGGITNHVTNHADKFAEGADIGKRWFSQKAEWLMFDYIYAFVAATTTEKLTGKLVKVFDKNNDEQEKPQPFSKVETAIHGGNLQDRFNHLAINV
jgi:hypothetical protein